MPLAAASRALVRALAVAAPLLAVGAPAAHAVDPVAATVDRTSGVAGPPPAAMQRAQARLRSELGGRALLQQDPTAATPRIVARLDGYLTGRSDRDPAAIALGYVRDHAAAFGMDATDFATLRLTARRRGTHGNVHLVWEQRVDGVPNVDGGLQAAVDPDGRLINVRGGPLPDPGASARTPRISPEAAYEAAIPGGASAPPAGAPQGAERRTPFLGGGEASLVLYRDGGADLLGWRVLVPAGSDAFYDAIVEAQTGQLERRVNRTRSVSRINHYDINPRAQDDAAKLSELPEHWLNGERRLKGPYVHAISDLDDSINLVQSGNGYHLSEEPAGSDEVEPSSPAQEPDLSWDRAPEIGFTGCPECSWTPGSLTNNRAFSTAQLFWYVNTFRDHLASTPIGFSGPGELKDADALIAQALNGAQRGQFTSTGNITVPPDGFPAVMQMYLYRDAATGRYDGAMDASLVYHEYTHALSERLVTDSQGLGALHGPQPGAVSEGTSDFYAMDFLADPVTGPLADTSAQGEIRVGNWLQLDPASKGEDAIRTEGLDCAIANGDPDACPGAAETGPGGYDYGDLGKVLGFPEIHADGEIWAQTLWSLRTALMAVHGIHGINRTRAYVTEGLRLSPEDPTFLDMRNAILQAAQTIHGGEDRDAMWSVFAHRGMGWTAETLNADDITPLARFDMPPGAETGIADSITQTSARVTGVIDPNGASTSFRYEFGETPALGIQTPVRAGGEGGVISVAETLTGLQPATTYYFRVVAVRGTHTLAGAVRTFNTGAAPPTPTPTPAPKSAFVATKFRVSKLTATRKGTFKVRVRFGSTAPAGKARIRVLLGKKRLAEGRLTVRPLRTSTKTLRLNRTGRRKIRPGSSRRVRLELRLPGGQKVKKTVRLTRKRR